MYKYHCLNPIARVGLDRFTPDYTKTNEVTEADGILVRSASMHEMELPDNLCPSADPDILPLLLSQPFHQIARIFS